MVNRRAGSPAARERWDMALERAFGGVVLAAFEGAAARSVDPMLLRWLDRTVEATGLVGPPYRFLLIESALANAWTVPGGTILVTRGLLEQVGSDDALAAVLAHEAAHVRKRHAWRQISENGAVLMLIGLLRGSSRDARTAVAIANGLRALAASRSMERDADDAMVDSLLSRGIDPRAITEFLGGSSEERGLSAWLATHPSDGARRRAIEERTRRRADWFALAEAYRERGRLRDAGALREGGRLSVGTVPAPAPDHDGKRRVLEARVSGIRDIIRRGGWEEMASGTLRTLLPLTVGAGDPVSLIAASRAWIVQQRVVDLAARIGRIAGVALASWDRLESADRLEAAVGRGEIEWGVEAGRGAVGRLEAARRAAGLVLANTVLMPGARLGRNDATTRFASRMGLLQVAESQLEAGERSAAEGWGRLCKARIRAYCATLGTLARRDAHAGQLARRWFEARTGIAWRQDEEMRAAVRRLICIAAGISADALAGSGADLADDAARLGVVESLAIVVRLCVLDLERELG